MWLLKSFFNKIQRSHTPKIRHFLNRDLKFESLEDRSLLSAVPAGWSLASVDSVVGSETPKIVLSLESEPDKEVIIGIDIVAQEGSGLKPGDITIYSYNAETGETDVTEEVTYLTFENTSDQESLIYVKLSEGEYHLTVASKDETEGSFTASVFLVGDSNHDGKVDMTDKTDLSKRISAIQLHNRGIYSQPTIKLYQSLYGIDITKPYEQLFCNLYDFNLDGILDGKDIDLVNQNLDVSVTVNLKIQLEGPSTHTASFDVGTGELVFDDTDPTLNVLDGVVDPFGYDMSATLVSVTPADPSYTVSDGAISISSDGNVQIASEILADDFDNLKRGETTSVAILYCITDTGSGELDGTIDLTVTGGNHTPAGNTSHAATFTSSTGSVIFDDLYTSLNLLDQVTDPDGDSLTAKMTRIIQPSEDTGYTVPDDAVSISENGSVQFDIDRLQTAFENVSASDSVPFTVAYSVYDSHEGSIDGENIVTVVKEPEGSQGVKDHTATVNLKNNTVTYDEKMSSLNLLSGVTDPQGSTLSVKITDINAGSYTLPTGAITQTDGVVGVKIDDFQETFKSMALDETSEVLVTFAVSNSVDNRVIGKPNMSVIGKYIPSGEEDET